MRGRKDAHLPFVSLESMAEAALCTGVTVHRVDGGARVPALLSGVKPAYDRGLAAGRRRSRRATALMRLCGSLRSSKAATPSAIWSLSLSRTSKAAAGSPTSSPSLSRKLGPRPRAPASRHSSSMTWPRRSGRAWESSLWPKPTGSGRSQPPDKSAANDRGEPGRSPCRGRTR